MENYLALSSLQLLIKILIKVVINLKYFNRLFLTLRWKDIGFYFLAYFTGFIN